MQMSKIVFETDCQPLEHCFPEVQRQSEKLTLASALMAVARKLASLPFSWGSLILDSRQDPRSSACAGVWILYDFIVPEIFQKLLPRIAKKDVIDQSFSLLSANNNVLLCY